MKNENQKYVPIWEKYALTIEEAATYTGIGINKLRELSNDARCPFVMYVGTKKLLRRKDLEKYLENKVTI